MTFVLAYKISNSQRQSIDGKQQQQQQQIAAQD
jgi:hypothetical protein